MRVRAVFALIAVLIPMAPARGDDSELKDSIARAHFADLKWKKHVEALHADPVFQRTIELCQGSFSEYFQFTKSGFTDIGSVGTLDIQAASRLYQNGLNSTELSAVLDSEAFQQALYECGKSGATTEEAVLTKMFVSDFVGKASGVVAIWLGFRLLGRVLKPLLASEKIIGGVRVAQASKNVLGTIIIATAITKGPEAAKAIYEVHEGASAEGTELNGMADGVAEGAQRIKNVTLIVAQSSLERANKQLQDPNLTSEKRKELEDYRRLLRVAIQDFQQRQ